jgi:hypothetical protein
MLLAARHATICVRILLCMCPRTTIFVSSYYYSVAVCDKQSYIMLPAFNEHHQHCVIAGGAQRFSRCALYLLYRCKSTNNDAECTA